MKRLLLELGGKGACIVFDDAELDAAVGCIGSTWSFHSGQICTAPTRAVVQRGVFDQVRRDARRATPARSKSATPPSSTPSWDRSSPPPSATGSSSHIATGRDEGARLVAGGRPPRAHGPRLLRRAHPVRGRQRHGRGPRGDLRARPRRRSPSTTRTRPSPSPTTATSGSTTTSSRATRPGPSRVAQQLRAGHVGINTAQRNHEAPFGGFKMSGVGRDGGDYGLEAYSELSPIVWTG